MNNKNCDNISVSEAVRKNNLRGKYNLTIEKYDKLLMEQNEVCAICSNKETHKNQYGIQRLGVDHSHQTGKIRGLLCHSCNIAIGQLKDSPILCMTAAKYLEGTENERI